MTKSVTDLTQQSPARIREAFREGLAAPTTSGLANGYAQLSLTILPAVDVDDFLEFARRNPRAVPVLATLPANAYQPHDFAAGADLRTDLPGYSIYRDGRLQETVSDIVSIWRDDLVCVLAGCSYSFEGALDAAGISLPHVRAGKSPAIYETNRRAAPFGKWQAPVMVTMRAIHRSQVDLAMRLSASYPAFHGEPLAVGDPGDLGIEDLASISYGAVPDLPADHVPVFWECNVTRHKALAAAEVPFAITNAPSQMFVTDLPISDFEGRLPLAIAERGKFPTGP